MGKHKSTLRERLTRAITESASSRIPVSNRPFEATARPKPPDDQAANQPTAAVQEASAPTTPAVRRPPTIRQRTTRLRQERLYETAPSSATTARQATLLATFGSTLSDLDDDDDEDNGREGTAERTAAAPESMPDIASLTIAGPSAAPPGTAPSAPPPATLPTPPPTPLPMTPAPPPTRPALLPMTPAPLPTLPAPLPAPGYFTGPPLPEFTPAASPPPGPPVPPAVAIPEGPFPEDALRIVPWNRIRPGQRQLWCEPCNPETATQANPEANKNERRISLS
ncbi:proline-rich receptor-like protein kinase PERK2 [Monomorium pharaonis]|uniref:proline-rich receptor-like protein kinase PERK2 n=1 Tax=Monomorium pharaonis TaxID=307658 RepID=UPI001746FEDB|nr:proline-rich receptor-like protein kinase PERK2 [Monomorium pharaonis]